MSDYPSMDVGQGDLGVRENAGQTAEEGAQNSGGWGSRQWTTSQAAAWQPVTDRSREDAAGPSGAWGSSRNTLPQFGIPSATIHDASSPFPWHQQTGDLAPWQPSQISVTEGVRGFLGDAFQLMDRFATSGHSWQQQQQSQQATGILAGMHRGPRRDNSQPGDMMPPASRRSISGIDARTPRSSVSDSIDWRRMSFASSDTGSRRGSSTTGASGSLFSDRYRRSSSLTGEDSRRGSTTDETHIGYGVPPGFTGLLSADPAFRLHSSRIQQAQASLGQGPDWRPRLSTLSQLIPVPASEAFQDRKRSLQSCDDSMGTPSDSADVSIEPVDSTDTPGGSGSGSAGKRKQSGGSSSGGKKRAQEQRGKERRLEERARELAEKREGIEEKIKGAQEEVERLRNREVELLAIQRVFDSEKKNLVAEIRAQEAGGTSMT